MKLKLKVSGGADALINYLRNYERIRSTLLIEFDPVDRIILAKGLTEERTSIRYSAISFESANITIANDASEEIPQTRVCLGIISYLSKFIKMLERMNKEVDGSADSSFTMEMSCIPTNVGEIQLMSCGILEFKSRRLDIRFNGFKIEEFLYIPDSRFFDMMHKVDSPVSFDLSSQSIASMVEVSDITKGGTKDDLLYFHITNGVVRATDYKDARATFSLVLGETDGGTPVENYFAVNRATFVQMLAKTDDDYKVFIGISPDKGICNKLIFDSVDGMTKITIARSNDDNI